MERRVGLGAAASQSEFEQANFQCERLLDIGVEQSLGRLPGFQIESGVLGAQSGSDLGGGGVEVGEEKLARGAQLDEPDVPKPDVETGEVLGTMATVLGLDGGGELAFPVFLLFRRGVPISGQRGIGRERGFDLGACFGEGLEQLAEQSVTGKQGSGLAARRLGKGAEPGADGFGDPDARRAEAEAEAAGEDRLEDAAWLGCEQEDDGSGGRFLEGLQEGIGCARIETVGPDKDRDFAGGFRGAEAKDPGDLAGLGRDDLAHL